jgi:hypothetical protein
VEKEMLAGSASGEAAAEEKPAAEVAAVEERPAPVAASPTTERVLLGSPDLTAGIPGEGDLATEQMQAWIDDPKKHT